MEWSQTVGRTTQFDGHTNTVEMDKYLISSVRMLTPNQFSMMKVNAIIKIGQK